MRGLPESSTTDLLGSSLRENPDTRGITKEAIAGIPPESWLEWGLGAEGSPTPRPPETDMLAAHDAVSTNSRKVQQKLGKLVNQGAGQPGSALRAQSVVRPAAGDGMPAGTGRPAGWERNQRLRQS